MGGLRQTEDEKDESICVVNKELRTIHITGEITAKLAMRFRRFVQQLEAQNYKRIVVELDTDGGDELAGFTMVDTIRTSKCVIDTLAVGRVFSMGVPIFLAGYTRMALSHARFMIHHGDAWANGSPDALSVELAEMRERDADTWALIDGPTNKPSGTWKTRSLGKDLYLNARTARKEGLIHVILGEE